MTYKRQLWSSGYEYRVRCPYCGTNMSYNDRQLGYRSWYPNGFVYCAVCRRPIRHSEIFAVHPDGSPVYRSEIEANQAIIDGYNRALGINTAYTAAPFAPSGPTATPPAQPVQPAQIPRTPPTPQTAGQGETAFCLLCGRQYRKGYDNYCSGCGNKLD